MVDHLRECGFLLKIGKQIFDPFVYLGLGEGLLLLSNFWTSESFLIWDQVRRLVFALRIFSLLGQVINSTLLVSNNSFE